MMLSPRCTNVSVVYALLSQSSLALVAKFSLKIAATETGLGTQALTRTTLMTSSSLACYGVFIGCAVGAEVHWMSGIGVYPEGGKAKATDTLMISASQIQCASPASTIRSSSAASTLTSASAQASKRACRHVTSATSSALWHALWDFPARTPASRCATSASMVANPTRPWSPGQVYSSSLTIGMQSGKATKRQRRIWSAMR